MKKAILLSMVSFIMIFLVGCQSSEIPKGSPEFCATVLEVNENTILVEPFESEEIRHTADKISVTTDVVSTINVPELEEDTTVCIVYNGEVAESSPAKINTVFAIYLLDENGEAIRK